MNTTEDQQAAATKPAEAQDTNPEQRSLKFANGSDYSFVGWHDGIFDLQRLRQEIANRAQNPDDGADDVAENQRFIVELAMFVNGIVPATANAGSLRNLHDAVLWLARSIDQMSRRALGV
jgi:hypothetical protein